MNTDLNAPKTYGLYNTVAQPAAPELASATIDLRSLRRHAWAVAGTIVLFAALALLFAMLQPSWYSASTRLIIDQRVPQFTRENTVFTISVISGPLVNSQVEILRSQMVMDRTFKLLAPLNVDDLMPTPSPHARVLDWLGLRKIPLLTEEQKLRVALHQLLQLITVRRVGETFAVDITARFKEPDMAARIANAAAQAYLENQANTNASATRGVSPWLQGRLKNSGTSARIISSAIPPFSKDGPRLLHLLIIFMIAGSGIGILGAFVCDFFDSRMRTPEQVTAVSSAECLGILPNLQDTDTKAIPQSMPLPSAPSLWGRSFPIFENSHTLERCFVAATLEHRNAKTIGITSCRKGEGKSTIALNLARTAANSDQRVLLVDTASDNWQLSKNVAAKAVADPNDTADSLFGSRPAVIEDPETGLHFLPCDQNELYATAPSIWNTAYERCAELLPAYDLMIFDLPALENSSATRIAAHSLDSILLVVEYATLRADTARTIIDASGPASQNIIGVLLNKVDEKNYRTYT